MSEVVVQFPLKTMAESNLIALFQQVDAMQKYLPWDALSKAEVVMKDRPITGDEALRIIAGNLLMLADSVRDYGTYKNADNRATTNKWFMGLWNS